MSFDEPMNNYVWSLINFQAPFRKFGFVCVNSNFPMRFLTIGLKRVKIMSIRH